MRTYLPAHFSGGLIITHKNDANTVVALKVKTINSTKSITNRYFDNLTLKSNSADRTSDYHFKDSIAIADTVQIDIFMAQNINRIKATSDFEVKFTRATYVVIDERLVNDGIWIALVVTFSGGCLIILCCIGVFNRKDKGVNEEQFYKGEDDYVRA